MKASALMKLYASLDLRSARSAKGNWPLSRPLAGISL
jgi:hypothetical protein